MELELITHLEDHLNEHITNVSELNDGLQNRVFSFYSGQVKLVARVTSSEKRTKEQLQAELEFMDTLNQHGIKTILPYKVNGHSTSTLKLNGDIYWVILFEFFEGNQVDVLNFNEWNDNFFRNWGKTIAKMHDTTQKLNYDFTRPVFIHDDGPINPIPALLEKVDPAIADIYESMTIELATFSKLPETFGLIHNDLHQGNFFVEENELILFDFDDCAYNWFAQDIAVSMYHALWTGESFHPDWTDFHEVFIAHFFEGYTSIRSISEEELKLICIFLRMRELFLFLLFKRTWNLDCLEEWQQAKLIELEESVRNGIVPYEDLLRDKWKHMKINQ